MKLPPFHLCLLAILFQAIFASSFFNLEGASLKNKESCDSKPKKVIGRLVRKRKLSSTNNKLSKKNKRFRKSKDAVIKKNKTKLLIDLLPKELVKLVIDYFNNDTYPISVSTHNWLLKDIRGIEVDNARVYVITGSGGLKGLNHPLASTNKDERHLMEYGDPQWFGYLWLRSSCDGRYVSFNHSYKPSVNYGKRLGDSTKWLTQSGESGDGKPKSVALDDKSLCGGILSRDGQTLLSYNRAAHPVTRVYRVREEAGREPVGLIKFELDGVVLAVSGKGNRVIVGKAGQLEIHDIGEDASKLACQIDTTGFMHICALNEDGREAAFVTDDGKLRIVEVGKVTGVKAGQPAVVTVPELLGLIYRLIYTEGDKLHVLHYGNKVSLFESSTKEFILLEAPQKGKASIRFAVSLNAEHIAILQEGDKKKQQFTHTTIVKRKLNKADLEGLFGYKADREKAATPEGKGEEPCK